jgi:hypothetical protein
MAISPAMLSMLFTGSARTGSIDFSFLAKQTSSGTAVANPGSIKNALATAEKNEAKQLATVAKDPQIQRDLARYARVVQTAKSVDEVLNDPVARKVLMTANGLGAYADNIALAKKAMTSNPSDASSVAVRMQNINSAWLQFAKDFNFPKYGLDRLSPRMDGFAGRWNITMDREGAPIEALLEVKKVDGVWSATANGVALPMSVEDGEISLTVIWEDAEESVHVSTLTGTLGKDGLSMSGPQVDDGDELDAPWKAVPYFTDSVKQVSDNYVAEKRLDMLDQQMPGLGSAMLFKQIAKDLDTPLKVLGSPLGREVVTTALGLPKQLALQSIQAQEKAIRQRMDPAKLKNEHFADQIAQRYLIMLNGGIGGVTA